MNTTISRRDFLASCAAAGALSVAASNIALADDAEAAAVDYVAAVGEGMRDMPVKDLGWPLFEGEACPADYEPGEIAADQITDTVDVDVLVIGGGVSGISAATTAADAGCNVLMVEKMSFGRNQWESVGGYGSTSQKEQGIEVNPAEYAKAIITAANYRCCEENVWSFLNNSGAAIDHLGEVLAKGDSGITIECTNNETDSVKGEHTFLNTGAHTWLLGPYVMTALEAVVASYENIEERFNTSGVKLVTADGAVTGAIIMDRETGAYTQVNAAKGVILSTGGYEMNAKMCIAWCRPEDVFSTSMSSTGTGSTGDGHMMGLEVGASMDPLPHCTMAFGGGYPQNGQFFHTFRSGIFVNSFGDRFVDESLMFNFTASALNYNNYFGQCWTVFDQSFIDAKAEASGTDLMGTTVADYMEQGFMVSGETVEELAEAMGVDAERLVATLDKWNGYFDAAEPADAEYLRDLSSCQAFTVAPFYAVKTNSSFLVTVSGLTIDADSRVLDKNQQVIPGLFATGNTSGGMFSDQYPRHLPATSVGRAVTTGYVAGRTAANA